MSRPLLIIDSQNLFVRNYLANPQMDNEGELVGGVIGYMKTLAGLVKRLSPRKVIVIWESGGSPRRLALFPEYKNKRKPAKTNRFYGDAIPDSEENKDYQIRCIIRLLKCLPIYQIYVENCEADDVIGYLCKSTFKDEDKIIVSSDKDFYQLLDGKTKIYTPGKKIFVKEMDVIEQFQIAPQNFCIAKAINGDVSDNIPGVPRVGFKSLAKKFDFVNEEVSIENIVQKSREHVEKTKKPLMIYENIADSEELIKRNYELMVLDDRMLSFDQINSVNRIVSEFEPKWKKMKFLREYLEMNLDGLDVDSICNTFSYLIHSK